MHYLLGSDIDAIGSLEMQEVRILAVALCLGLGIERDEVETVSVSPFLRIHVVTCWLYKYARRRQQMVVASMERLDGNRDSRYRR